MNGVKFGETSAYFGGGNPELSFRTVFTPLRQISTCLSDEEHLTAFLSWDSVYLRSFIGALFY